MSSPPRLLSLLSLIESALNTLSCPAVNKPPQRMVNFQKGIARIAFGDGSGAITLQNFTLADGQICVKAAFSWANSDATGSCSIYPNSDNFDWFGAAAKIAEGWMNGIPEPASANGENLQAAV
jgi:hypothetical protein